MNAERLERISDIEFLTGVLPDFREDDATMPESPQDRFRGSREDSDASGPVVRLVDEIMSEAIHAGASDIHFEPSEGRLRVRVRVDGLLREQRSVPEEMKAELLSRVKIMADLDIAEKRRPQDGRIRVQSNRRRIDMRVSTLPTDHGEKIVLRILDKGGVALDLASLGFSEDLRERLLKAASRPWGMILVTGPTGSGKTTTLYSLIQAIRSADKNITTVEDPIEYRLEGITQTAVKPEIDLTFANALRSILRQDPNIILVGEIRDKETAEIAVRAALTGHLVLSTLHTNDAASAPGRLIDMGVEPFLVASALHVVVAQRLVRRLCPQCKVGGTSDVSSEAAGVPAGSRTWEPGGCPACGGAGFAGRIAIGEILELDDPLREGIMARRDAAGLKSLSRGSGDFDLRGDGVRRVLTGETTWREVLRETV